MTLTTELNLADSKNLLELFHKGVSPEMVADLVELAAGEVEFQTKQRFEEQKDPQGRAWAAWSAAYAKRRKGGHSLLQDTGLLLHSINTRAVSGGAHVGVDKGKLSAGAPRNYALYHQEGTKKMPQRAFIGLSAKNKAALMDSLNDYLKQT